MTESKFRKILLLVILGLFFFSNDSFSAGEKHQSKILFLQFKIKNDRITLVKTTIKPGLAKQPASVADKNSLYYQLFSPSGASLGKGSMKDPLIQHFEYEDPDHPGQIKRKEIQLKETEFTLRIPYDPDLQEIEFFKLLPSNLDSQKQSSLPKSLGKIKLQIKEDNSK